MSLLDQVKEHVDHGCTECSHSLGIQSMPSGYALMLDSDHMFFYWLKEDGTESSIHWNKWAVWRGAVDDSKVGA